MPLADVDILKYIASEDPREHIGINPFKIENLKGDGYDVTLGEEALSWKEYGYHIKPGADIDAMMVRSQAAPGEFLVLRPGDCVLAATREYIKLPSGFCAFLHGRSSIARLFIAVHVTAGEIDPGFEGYITIELVNHSKNTVYIPVGITIGKLVFLEMCCHPERLYLGRYQGAMGVQASRLWLPEGMQK